MELPVTAKRPGIVTLLAVLQLGQGAFLLLVAMVCVAVAAQHSADSVAVAVAGVLFGLLGALQVACGIGLWNLKGYGRTIQLAFAWIGLVGIPIGTIISILILVYLNKPGIRILFSDRPPSAWTPYETEQVAAAMQSSLATALTIVVAVFLVVFLGGVIAATAVPGLLRARMSGNEASAIGTLRAINSAQAVYATQCNGYAPDLGTLERSGTFPRHSGAGQILTQNGYNITLEPLTTATAVANIPAGCTGSVTDYFAHADPVTLGSTGTRHFATDARGTIVQSTDRAHWQSDCGDRDYGAIERTSRAGLGLDSAMVFLMLTRRPSCGRRSSDGGQTFPSIRPRHRPGAATRVDDLSRHQLNASVLGPPIFRIIGGNRREEADALRIEPLAGDAEVGHERSHDRLCAAM